MIIKSSFSVFPEALIVVSITLGVKGRSGTGLWFFYFIFLPLLKMVFNFAVSKPAGNWQETLYLMLCWQFARPRTFSWLNQLIFLKSLPCSLIYTFFSIKVFFHRHWRFTGQQGKGGDHLLFHSITSTRSRTFRHLFATLHVSWLSRISNCNTCVYQTATRWDLPPYWITIWLINWLIDDVMFACVLDDLILGLCYNNLTRWSGEFELASTITLVFQANRLTKCATHSID